jgi:hypothetical protein
MVVGGVFGISNEAWVAIGTLTLAAVTASLAATTWWLARVSRSEVASTVRPLLVDAPPGIFMREQELGSRYGFRSSSDPPGPRYWADVARSDVRVDDDGVARLDFSIRNTGNGTALLRPNPGIFFPRSSRQTTKVDVELSHTAVPVGEPARVSVLWRDSTATDRAGAQSILASLMEVKVTLEYTDLNGKQLTASTFILRVSLQHDQLSWAVYDVDITHGHKRKPYAHLSPGATLE